MAAAAIGIPQPTLHKILCGKSASPRAITLQRIAEHFDASLDWMITGKGEPPKALSMPSDTITVLEMIARSRRLHPHEQDAVRDAISALASQG